MSRTPKLRHAMTDPANADTGRALEGRTNFGRATGVDLKRLVRRFFRVWASHYPPIDESYNGTHIYFACAGSIRVGIGFIWPENIRCDLVRCHWKRTGFTIWLYRVGFGLRWRQPWPGSPNTKPSGQ